MHNLHAHVQIVQTGVNFLKSDELCGSLTRPLRKRPLT